MGAQTSAPWPLCSGIFLTVPAEFQACHRLRASLLHNPKGRAVIPFLHGARSSTAGEAASFSRQLALNAPWLLPGQWVQLGALTAARTSHHTGRGPGLLSRRQ